MNVYYTLFIDSKEVFRSSRFTDVVERFCIEKPNNEEKCMQMFQHIGTKRYLAKLEFEFFDDNSGDE